MSQISIRYLTPDGFHLCAFGDLRFHALVSSLYFLNEISFYGTMRYKHTPKHTVSISAKALVQNSGFETKA